MFFLQRNGTYFLNKPRNLLVTYIDKNRYQEWDVPSHKIYVFMSMSQQPIVGHDFLIIEASRSHPDTPHSVGLLWTRDQPEEDNSTWQHKTLKRDRHPCNRRDSNPQPQEASGQQTYTSYRAASEIDHYVGHSVMKFSQYYFAETLVIAMNLRN